MRDRLGLAEHLMEKSPMQDRISHLREEMVRLRQENQQYFASIHHGLMDDLFQCDRETRLAQILEELAALTKKKAA